MFTWICPQCGREVPPSYSECPTCAENRARGNQPASVAAPPPQAPVPSPQYPPQQYPAPQYQAPQQPPQQYPPPPQQAAQYQAPSQWLPQPPQYHPAPPEAPPPPPAYAAAPPPPPPLPQQADIQHSQPYYVVGDQAKKKGMPTWLVMVLTAAVLGGVLFGVYKLVDGGSITGGASKAAEKAQEPIVPGNHPYAKYVEITGLRISEHGKSLKVQYLVVNHSAAELAGLELRMALTTASAKPEDPPLAQFDASVGNVEPFGSKEMDHTVTTNLRAYELPDWQFLKATFEITGPK